jgi:hypothetical protein
MCSLYLLLLDKAGVHLDRFGDSNQRLAEIGAPVLDRAKPGAGPSIPPSRNCGQIQHGPVALFHGGRRPSAARRIGNASGGVREWAASAKSVG